MRIMKAIKGTTIGDINGDTGSLDYGSFEPQPT